MNSTLTQWATKYLAGKRELCDPVADEVIATLIRKGEKDTFHNVWRKLSDARNVDYSTLPQDVRGYFESTNKLPDWADEAKIKKGQAIFREHGMALTLLLLCKSLPQCYACANGAEVLAKTGRLTAEKDLKPFTRRLMETAQFVINVMVEDGLHPKGLGTVTAQKIRLIHASIRHYLRRLDWDEKKYGAPINQEDMAGTLMAFSALPLDGLEQLNIKLSDESKDAYIHTWAVVGHFMGVDHDIIPKTYAQSHGLGEAIFLTQIKASESGVVLQEALVEYVEDVLPGRFKEIPKAMIHYFIGDEASEAIGLKIKHNWLDRFIENTMGFVFREDEVNHPHGPLWNKISSEIQVHLMQGLINHYNKHRKVTFFIPPSLRADWNLDR